MEPYVLPGLIVLMVGFVAYIAWGWLRNKDERALSQFDRDDDSRRR